MRNVQIPKAIPGCLRWRIANPELTTCEYDMEPHEHAAPYCCSAYCPRCAYLRAQDGVPPLEPNEWITRA